MNDATIERFERLGVIIAVLLFLLVLRALGTAIAAWGEFLLPLVLAVFLMSVINPIIAYLEKRKLPGPLAVLLSILLFVLIFGLVGMVIENSIDDFALELPKYQRRIDTMTQNIEEFLKIDEEQMIRESGESPNWILSVLQKFTLSDALPKLAGTIGDLLSDTLLVFLFMLFFLSGRNTLIPKIKRAFPENISTKIAFAFNNINHQVQQYMLIKTFVSLLTGAVTFIVLHLFGVDFAEIWALLTFLLNFIPSIGSFIATLLPVLAALLQFDSYAKVVGLAICLFAGQFFMGNILEPRILGKRVNLSPVFLMFALIYWGWQWGIIGMLLAVPLAVITKIICENIPPLRFLAILMSSNVSESAVKNAKT